MYLVGQHKVTFESIRRLTVECFALHSSGYLLLQSGVSGNYPDKHGRTAELYEELVSEKLLHLAVALRTKFYHGADHRTTSRFLEDTGILTKYDTFQEKNCLYTLKDVCDMVIHANEVCVTIDTDWEAGLLELWGQQTFGGKEERWDLHVSVPALCKGILEWLDTMEA
jgi:hypothetical protein